MIEQCSFRKIACHFFTKKKITRHFYFETVIFPQQFYLKFSSNE